MGVVSLGTVVGNCAIGLRGEAGSGRYGVGGSVLAVVVPAGEARAISELVIDAPQRRDDIIRLAKWPFERAKIRVCRRDVGSHAASQRVKRRESDQVRECRALLL